MKKDKNPRAPQVGDYIEYEGKKCEVRSIKPEDETFWIYFNGSTLNLSGYWDIYI